MLEVRASFEYCEYWCTLLSKLESTTQHQASTSTLCKTRSVSTIYDLVFRDCEAEG